MYLPRPVVRALCTPTYRLALNPDRPIRVQRLLTELGSASLRPPRGTSIEHVRLGGRPAEKITARPGSGAVLFLHGGGYVLGSARMYRAMAGYLAQASGAIVCTLDYRLAPEHPYPAALDDAVAAFHSLVDDYGFAPGQIAIAGDSAGGGLAVAAARRLSDAGCTPGALGLLSPWTDPSDTDLAERDFVVNRPWGIASAALYRGAADPGDPGYAPMHTSLAGLPPMLIHVGADEILKPQIRRFAARAHAEGVDARLVELPQLWHSGHLLAGMLHEATDAVAAVGRFVRIRLAAGAGECVAP